MVATVPSPPTTPVVVSQNQTQITVSWSANTNNGGSAITSYQLYWSGNSFASPIATLTSTTTVFTVTSAMGVVSGNFYSFYVVSINLIGSSNSSVILQNVIAGSLPTAPINFKRATTITPVATRISLQWDAPVSNGGLAIQGYTIFWNGGVIGGATPRDFLITTTALTTFNTVSNLVRGNTYMFTVAAINQVGTGPISEILTLIAS